MTYFRVIGVDPGPTPGIALLEGAGGELAHAEVLQCTPRLLEPVLTLLSQDATCVAVERFVARGRASKDQALTRDQVSIVVSAYGAVQRNASQVKAWATDTRLEAAGLLEACTGMRHARDAARHALFAAVHDGAIPDPLSKEWNR